MTENPHTTLRLPTPMTLEGVLNRISTDGANYIYHDFIADTEEHLGEVCLYICVLKDVSKKLSSQEWKEKVIALLNNERHYTDEFTQRCKVAVVWKDSPGVFLIFPTNIFASGIVAEKEQNGQHPQ